MSTLKVEVVTIKEINPHPNADRLELATVKGWQCVVKKDGYRPGDKAIYIPIDSIVPPKVECKIFGPNSKVKLNKSRVKTIKLRGAISQGLIVDLKTLNINEKTKVGEDLTKILGITKYEPPIRKTQSNFCAGKPSKKQENPYFRKYTGIENFKNYPEVFEDGEIVSITEKIHGTNFRVGYVPSNSLWTKIKKFLGIDSGHEFVFGSHNVQLQNKAKTYSGFYDESVYAKTVKKYNLDKILQPGEVIYGEIYGSGIQKNYKYGCKEGEYKLVVFDLMIDGQYQDIDTLKRFCKDRGLDIVPELYRGPFDMEVAKSHAKGDSIFVPEQDIREGVVIKPIKESTSYMGRKILKLINDDYLLRKGNTDHH